MNREEGTLFIISGPSGVGKTTVVTKFLELYAAQYDISRVVTYTTKKPRSTELHGSDYHFITKSEFEQKVQENFFLEWSGDYGAYYGSPADVLQNLEQGKSYILIVDRAGTAQILKKYLHAVAIWIKPSSIDALSERLIGRKTETFEQIQTRLLLAKKEIEEESHFSFYNHHIINDDLKACIEGLFGVISSRCFSVKKDII